MKKTHVQALEVVLMAENLLVVLDRLSPMVVKPLDQTRVWWQDQLPPVVLCRHILAGRQHRAQMGTCHLEVLRY